VKRPVGPSRRSQLKAACKPYDGPRLSFKGLVNAGAHATEDRYHHYGSRDYLLVVLAREKHWELRVNAASVFKTTRARTPEDGVY
jgi:hypothetical protein